MALAAAVLAMTWAAGGSAHADLCDTTGDILPLLGSVVRTADDTVGLVDVCTQEQEPEPEPDPSEPEPARPTQQPTAGPRQVPSGTGPLTSAITPVTELGDLAAPTQGVSEPDGSAGATSGPPVVAPPLVRSASAGVAPALPIALGLVVAVALGMLVGRSLGERAARRRSQAATAAAMDAMPEGVIQADRDGRIIAINTAAQELMGTAPAEVRGRMIWGALTGVREDGASLPRWVREVLGTEAGTTATLGRRGLPVAVALVPAGTAGLMCVLRDLRPERALHRMKQDFLANISHELRTPLTSAMGFARMLRNPEVPLARKTDFADSIVEACERLDRVVDLLLDVTAIDGGHVSAEGDRVDPGVLVEDTLAAWRVRSPHHVFDARETTLPKLRCNAGLVRQALDELIDNAVKFSPDGGLVTIATATRGKGPERRLELTVSDQGVGIAPERAESVLGDFEQADASATRAYGGLGMGLAFVRRVAALHGGGVTISSDVGSGTSVTLVLPAPARASQPSRARSSRGGRVAAASAR